MNASEPYNERELLHNLKGGSELAFRKILDKYNAPIFRFSMGYIKSKEFAEEIVQETFMKLWIKRGSINPELSFESFLFQIAKNTIHNFLKKAANDRKLCEAIFYKNQYHDNALQDQISWSEYQLLAKEAIDLLSERQRQIFILAKEQGMSYAEIGQQLNISPNTVKNHLVNATKEIRYFLEKHGDIAFTLWIIYQFG